jgi:hypothetical protein
MQFLCENLGPCLQRQHTHLKEPILVESRVALSLQRLENGNTLCIIQFFIVLIFKVVVG